MDFNKEEKLPTNLKEDLLEEEEEEEKNNTKIYENEKEEENYEFLIPISNNNKLKTFVDRYFLKYYSIYSKEPRLFQYVYVHTNKSFSYLSCSFY